MTKRIANLAPVYPALLLATFCTALAAPALSAPDLSWIRAYTVPATSDTTADAEAGKENMLNWDPRFSALLKGSLPQNQRFWFDEGRFTPLPELVHLFIGVPGSALLEENRYVTINGCVPHDCGDRGMVWIDTAEADTPALIFVATGPISSAPTDRNTLIHLWLFSSTKVNWQKPDPHFQSSLLRWWNKTTQVWNKYSSERIIVVTLVQPSGEMVDLSPSLFAFQ